MVDVVVKALDKDLKVRQNAKELLLETIAHETLFGTFPDYSKSVGMGLCQFDRIAFDDVIQHCEEHFDTIKEKLGIDLTWITYEDLRYNPFLSIIMARLKYKRVPKAIPSNTEERFKYYKTYYNSSEGKADYVDFMNNARDMYRALKQEGIKYA